MATPIRPNPPLPEGNNFVVEVDIRIQQRWYASQTGQMQLRETFHLPDVSTFTELAKILGEFHDLAGKLGTQIET